MRSLTLSDVPFLFFVPVALVLVAWASGKRNRLRLPPGPPRLPLIGNLLDMRSDHKDWLAYYSWGRQYGNGFRIARHLTEVLTSNPRRHQLRNHPWANIGHTELC